MHDDAPHSARRGIDAPTTSAVAVSSLTPSQAALEALLADDEQIVWQGQPIASQRFWRKSAIWLFAVPWTWFAVCGGPAKPMLFVLPFLAIGVVLMASPWHAWWVARHTSYAITTRRLLIVERRLALSDAWMSEAREPVEPERRRRRDGSGSLIFARFVVGRGKGRRTVERGFVDIADVMTVEALLRQTFRTLHDR